MRRWLAAAALTCGTLAIGAVAATAEESAALRAVPDRVVLVGPDAVQQVAVEEGEAGIDRTGAAEFASADPAVAVVDESGTI